MELLTCKCDSDHILTYTSSVCFSLFAAVRHLEFPQRSGPISLGQGNQKPPKGFKKYYEKEPTQTQSRGILAFFMQDKGFKGSALKTCSFRVCGKIQLSFSGLPQLPHQSSESVELNG